MGAGGRTHLVRRADSPGHCRGSRPQSPLRSWRARSCPAKRGPGGGRPAVGRRWGRSPAPGTLTIHMPSKGTWAWNSDTMSCHQSRASGLVKSGKAVSPGHTCNKGQRGDQAPRATALPVCQGGKSVEVRVGGGRGRGGTRLRSHVQTEAPEPSRGHLLPWQPPRPPSAGTPFPLVAGTPWNGKLGTLPGAPVGRPGKPPGA